MTPEIWITWMSNVGVWLLTVPTARPDTIRIAGAPPIAEGLEPCLTYLGEAARIALGTRGITDGDVPVLRDGQTLGAISLRGGEITIGIAKQGAPE